MAQTLATLSRIYTWANKVGLLACPNPIAGCERPHAVCSVDYLSRKEAGALLEHYEKLAPAVYPMVAAALLAGLRKGELYGLRWCDIAFDAGRIDVHRSYLGLPKGGKSRHLPLHPHLAAILQRWRNECPATEEGLVFPVEDRRSGRHRTGRRDETRDLAELLRAAGCHVPLKPWHCLRHTFASHFMMAGGNILTLQKLLGHSDLKMTMVYAHLAPDFLATEVARLSFEVPSAEITYLDDARGFRVGARGATPRPPGF